MGPRFRPVVIALVALGAWCSAGVARAAPPDAVPLDTPEPIHSRRLVHLFDFEDTIEGAPLGRFERLPMHWYVMGTPDASSDPNFLSQALHQRLMGSPGFSRHSEVRFDKRHKSSGDYSFFLGLDSGDAGAFLQIGTLPAIADIDYLIRLKVRTSQLEHASARVVVYFVDSRGVRIEESVTTSGPLRTAEQWQDVSIRLSGEHPQAAWIGMQLEVLQAEHDVKALLGDRQIVFQEVRGGAWFDDIAVWQLPHVQLRTQNRVNIVRPPQRPQLAIEVRDLTGQALVAQVTVYDHTLHLIARQERNVGAGEPSQWNWTPDLPRFGWYLVDLQVRPAPGQNPGDSAATFIARNLLAMLYMNDDRALDPTDAAQFGIRAEDISQDELLCLAELLEQARLGAAVISAWDRSTTLEKFSHRQKVLEQVIENVMANSGRLTFSLYPLPDELAQHLDLDADAATQLFSPDVSFTQWSGYLTPVTLQYGQRVRQWQMGSSEQTQAFHRKDLPRFTPSMVRTLTNLAPNPLIIMPWQISQSRRDDVRERPMFALHVPPSVRPEDLSGYLAPWRAEPAIHLRLDLREPPATWVHHPGRIEDLALRMVYAWEAGAAAMTLPRPWTLANDRTTRLLPDPLLGVFSTVTHRLAGRRAVGRLPLGPGLEAVIFDGKGGGMIVAWNRFAPAEKAKIDMYLGERPVAIDVFGNHEALTMFEGRHQLTLGATPIFIEGIDAQLALFRARFQIDEPFIESTQTVHHRSVTICNPWSRTITGRMRIAGPAAWEIQPRLTNFSIAAGESTTVALAIKFPISETAGDKRLVAQFDFTADQRYQLDVSDDLMIGLRDVAFEANVVVLNNPDTGRRDALVSQLITNTGQRTISLYTFANLTGYTRQERLVSRLKPGQTVSRHFTFADAEAVMSTNRVRAGIRQANGPAMLTYILEPKP